MKYLNIALIIMGMCACLRAPHDHPFDPDNPDKGYISGTVYKYDNTRLADVDIKLYYYHDTTLYDETKSDVGGDYYFEEIDPGIYIMIAKYGYFAPVEIDPCSLPAETYNDTFDIWIGHMYFPFEDESIGTFAPKGFSTVAGDWVITNYAEDPDEHTVPRVYAGTVSGMGSSITLVNERMRGFFAEVNILVMDWPAEQWGAGLLFRYQNQDNFYAACINHHRLTIIKREAGSSVPLASDSSLYFLPNEWYCLGVECCEDSLHVLVDGERKLSAVDNSYESGNVGLWISNNDTTTTNVVFDDVDIWP